MNVNTTRPASERPSLREQLDRSGHLWYAEKLAREFRENEGELEVESPEFAAIVDDLYLRLSDWNINGHRFAVVALLDELVHK